jgi:hypothetical protein
MIYHTLGETVTFAEAFYDADGVATTMDSVTAVVTYPGPIGTDGTSSRTPGKGTTTVTMTEDTDTGQWTGSWDSSEAGSAGTVFVRITGVGGTNTIVQDNAFVLRANEASFET